MYHAPVPRARNATVTQRHIVRVKAKPAARTPKRSHAKAVHARRKAGTVVHRAEKANTTHKTLPPKLAPHSKVSDEISLQSAARTTSASSGLGLASLLIVLALVGAIGCFAVALVPATYMRWRPAVIFASERQTDLTVAGLALLTVTAFVVVLSRGL